MAAEAELDLNINAALDEVGKLSDAFDDIFKDLGKTLSSALEDAFDDAMKGVLKSFEDVAEDVGKVFDDTLTDVFETQATALSDQLATASEDFAEKMTEAFSTVDYEGLSTGVTDALDTSFGEQLVIPFDYETITTEIDDALATAVSDPLLVEVDQDLLGTSIDEAVAAAAPAPIEVPIDSDTVAAELDDAVSAAEIQPVSLPIDVSGLADDITAALTDIDLSGADLSGISDSFDSGSQSANGFGQALDTVEKTSLSATDQINVLDGVVQASSAAAAGASGNWAGLFGTFARGALAFGGVVLGIKALTDKGEAALEANRQLTRSFGELAGEIDKVPIGATTRSMSELGKEVGFSSTEMKQQLVLWGDLAKGSSLTKEEVVGTAQTLESLGIQLSVINPKLGSADQIVRGLGTALTRGGRAASRFGLNISQTEITMKAAEDRAGRLGISVDDAKASLTQADKEAAGAALAIKQLGDNAAKSGKTLEGQFAEGSKAATVQFRALRQVVSSQLAGIGKEFVAPVLAITTALVPFGTALIAFFGDAISAVLPIVVGGIQALSTAFGPLLKILPTVLDPIRLAFTLLEAPIASLGLAFRPLTRAIADFVTGASFLVTPLLVEFFRGFAEAVRSAVPVIRDAAKFIGELFPSMQGLTDSIKNGTGLGGILATIAHGLGKVAGVGAGILAVALSVKTLVVAVSGIKKVVGGVSSVVSIFGKLNPVVVIIGAVAAALFTLYEKVPAVRTAIDSLAKAVSGTLGKAFETVSSIAVAAWGVLTDAWEIFRNAMVGPLNVLTTRVLPAFGAVFSAIGDVVSSILEGIGLLIDGLLGSWKSAVAGFLSSDLAGFFSKMGTVIYQVLWNVQSLLNGVADSISAWAKTLNPAEVASAIQAFFAPVADAVGWIADTVLPIFTQAWHNLTDDLTASKLAVIGLTAAFAPMLVPILAIIDAFDPLASLLDTIVTGFQEHLAGSITLVTSIVVAAGGAWLVFSGALATAFTGIGVGAVALEGFITTIGTVGGAGGALAGISSAFTGMTGAIAALGPAIGAAAAAAAPFIAIAAAVAAVAAIIIFNWDSVVKFLQPLGESIGTAFSNLAGPIQSLMDGMSAAFGEVSKLFSDVWDRLKTLGAAFAASPIGKVLGVILEVGRAITEIGIAVVIAQIGTAFRILGAILQPVVQVLRGVINVVLDVFTALFQLISLDFGGFADSLGNIFGDIGAIFDGLGKIITEGIGAALSGIGAMFLNVGKQILASAGAVFGDIGSAIAQGVWDGFQSTLNFVDAIVGWFSDAVDAVLNFLGISSPSKTFMDIGLNIVEGIISGLAGFAGAVLNAIVSAFIGLGQLMLDGIEAEWNLVIEWFTTIPQLILDALSAVGSALLEVGSWLIEQVWNGLQAYVHLIVEFWTTVPQLIWQGLQAVGGLLLQAGGWLIRQVWTGIQAAAGLLWTFFVQIPAKIVGLLGDAAGWLLGVGQKIVTGLRNALETGIPIVWAWFKQIPSTIINLLSNAASWLLGIGEKVITGLQNGIESAASGIWNFFKSIPGKIIGFVGDAGRWLLNLGKQVIQGFINGITSIDLGDIIEDVFGGFVSGVGDFLGISSPSRVMHKMGEETGEGYKQGVDSKQGEVEAAGTAMGKSVQTGVEGGLSGSQAGILRKVNDLIDRGLTGAAIKKIKDNKDKIKTAVTDTFGASFDDIQKTIADNAPDIGSIIAEAAKAATPTNVEGQAAAPVDITAFTASLEMQSVAYQTWVTNLDTLVKNGNVQLAQQIGQLGPEGGAALAAQLVAQGPEVQKGAETMLDGVTTATIAQQAKLAALSPAFGSVGLVLGAAFASAYGLGANPIPEITNEKFATAAASISSDPKLIASGSVAGGKVTQGYGTALRLSGVGDEELKKALTIFEADKPSNGGAGKLGKNQKEAFAKALLLAGASEEAIKTANKTFDDDTKGPTHAGAHGKRIGQSLKDGMKEPIKNSRDLDEAIQGAVDRAILAGRQRAGVSSPSKLFAKELGLPIVQGIAIGIAEGGNFVSNEIDALVGRVASASVDMSGIVSGLNSIPTQVNAVAPDGRPVEIKQLTVTMQASLDAPTEKVIEQGNLIGIAAGQHVVSVIRGV